MTCEDTPLKERVRQQKHMRNTKEWAASKVLVKSDCILQQLTLISQAFPIPAIELNVSSRSGISLFIDQAGYAPTTLHKAGEGTAGGDTAKLRRDCLMN